MSQDVERERLDVDILFVGAGPATLSAAIHLADQCSAKPGAVNHSQRAGPVNAAAKIHQRIVRRRAP